MKTDTMGYHHMSNGMAAANEMCHSPPQHKFMKTSHNPSGESPPHPGSPALSTTSSHSTASGRTEPPKRLRYWLIDMIDSGEIPGLRWENSYRTVFRIPWKHAGKNNWKEEDCKIFKAWAQHRGKWREGEKLEAATWKTRLRCALNKLPDIKEVKEKSCLEGNEPYRVYQLLPETDRNQDCEIFPRVRSQHPSDSPVNPLHHSPLNESELNNYMLQRQQENPMPNGNLFPQTSTYNNAGTANPQTARANLTSPQMDPRLGGGLTTQNSQMHPQQSVHSAITENHLTMVPPPTDFNMPNHMFPKRTSPSEGYEHGGYQNGESNLPHHRLVSPSGSDTLPGPMDAFEAEELEPMLQMSQMPAPCALQPPEQPPQPHEMEIYVKYRGYTVMAYHVVEPTGCRVHYGDASLQLIAVAQHELPSSVFGPESLQQIGLVDCAPYAVSKKQVDLTNHVLQNIKRGLMLSYDSKKGCFYAKRLCQSRVFYFGPESPGTTPEKLDRHTSAKVFDYHTFCNQLRRFASDGRSGTPDTELQVSFGQNWSIKNPIEKNLVTLTMVPRAAKYLLQKVQMQRQNVPTGSINESIVFESGPDSYDVLAKRATDESGKCIDELIKQMAGMDPNAPLPFRNLPDTRIPTSQQTGPYATGFFQENVIPTAPIVMQGMDDVEMTGLM